MSFWGDLVGGDRRDGVEGGGPPPLRSHFDSAQHERPRTGERITLTLALSRRGRGDRTSLRPRGMDSGSGAGMTDGVVGETEGSVDGTSMVKRVERGECVEVPACAGTTEVCWSRGREVTGWRAWASPRSHFEWPQHERPRTGEGRHETYPYVGWGYPQPPLGMDSRHRRTFSRLGGRNDDGVVRETEGRGALRERVRWRD